MKNNVSDVIDKSRNPRYISLKPETNSGDETMTKRMQLQLDEDTYNLIKELSEVSGMSASALVTVMFQISRQDLERILGSIKSMGNRPAIVFDHLVDVLNSPRHSYGVTKLSTRRAKGSSKGGSDD